MSLPELFANPPTPGVAPPWYLADLAAAITTTPAAGTVEAWSVSAAAPAALRGSQGRFTVIIDSEIMHVYAKPDGSSPWYFARGMEGSSVATHSSGAHIALVLTQGARKSARRPAVIRSRRSYDVIRQIRNPGPTDNPTATLQTTGNQASTITGAAALGGYQFLPNDARLKITGAPGPMVAQGTSYPQTIEYTAKGGVTKTLGNFLPFQVHFDAYCSKLELAFLGNGNNIIVYVNGVKAYSGALPNSGQAHNLLLDWTATSGLKQRQIRVECQSDTTWLGFYMLATETLMNPSAYGGGLRIISTGDSWLDGTGTADGISGFNYTVGRLLGIQDSWMAGIGGTGYLQTSSQGNNLRPRIASDIVANNPDIVLLSFGSDDVTNYTATQVAAEAKLAWEQIMSSLPDAVLIVLGPYACPAAGATAGAPASWPTSAPYDTALAAAAADLGVPYISPIQEAWIVGSGHVGATAGNGPADTLIYTDGVHPSQAGHDFMAWRTAGKIAGIIESL